MPPLARWRSSCSTNWTALSSLSFEFGAPPLRHTVPRARRLAPEPGRSYAHRTGDRAMTKLLRWYLRLLAGLTIISGLGQLGLPAQLAVASAWGVAPGWQREIAFLGSGDVHHDRPNAPGERCGRRSDG